MTYTHPPNGDDLVEAFKGHEPRRTSPAWPVQHVSVPHGVTRGRTGVRLQKAVDARFLADQFALYRPMLVRFARQRLRNDAWADDAVSETLLAALERPGAYAGQSKLQTWLVGILKHKVIDQIRRHTRECQADATDGELESEDLHERGTQGGTSEVEVGWGDPQEQLSRRQFVEQLDRCLRMLPPKQARAVLLRDCLEEETDSICDELGVTANNLGVMLHRARSRLREALQAHRMWSRPRTGSVPRDVWRRTDAGPSPDTPVPKAGRVG